MGDKPISDTTELKACFADDMVMEYKLITRQTVKNNQTLVKCIVIVIIIALLAVSGLTIYFTQKSETKDIAHAKALAEQQTDFIDYLSMYDFTDDSVDVKQDTKDGGNANYLSGDGEITNGKTESKGTQENTDSQK